MKQEKNIESLVRIAGTNLNGEKTVLFGLANIKGVGITLAHALCKVCNLPAHERLGSLSPEQVKKIEATVEDPLKAGLPAWLVNRRRDPETGEDKHLSGTDIMLTTEEDKKGLKKMKAYRGFRHQWGLPVRGQRTKSNFRRNKGKVSGVKRKK